MPPNPLTKRHHGTKYPYLVPDTFLAAFSARGAVSVPFQKRPILGRKLRALDEKLFPRVCIDQ